MARKRETPAQRRLKKKVETIRRANLARKYGFNLSYNGNAKNSPQQLAAVSRAYNRIKYFANDERYVFKKIKRSNLKKIDTVIESDQVTPGGVFIRVPHGIKASETKVKYDKRKKALIVETPVSRDELIKMDPVLLSKEPVKYIQSTIDTYLKGRPAPRFIKVVVYGHEANTQHSISTKGLRSIFYNYWEGLIDELLDDDYQRRVEKKKGRLSYPEISEMMHIKFIY